MECTIKDHDYRVAKLSVFDQLKVTRKLLTVKSIALSLMRLIRCLKPCYRASLMYCLP